MTTLVIGGRLASGNAFADLCDFTLARSRGGVGSFELRFENVRLVFLRESQIDLRLYSRTKLSQFRFGAVDLGGQGSPINLGNLGSQRLQAIRILFIATGFARLQPNG